MFYQKIFEEVFSLEMFQNFGDIMHLRNIKYVVIGMVVIGWIIILSMLYQISSRAATFSPVDFDKEPNNQENERIIKAKALRRAKQTLKDE
mmetsp:Transcript_22505/g.31315  ORF Transcript_22505/g.31315 Transcript_22505/m.31315 type:complete len:91 (+) Transcript_22505:222-494(+)